jgi:hypothetical protein
MLHFRNYRRMEIFICEEKAKGFLDVTASRFDGEAYY